MIELSDAIRQFDLHAYLDPKGGVARGDEIAIECPQCGKEKLIVNARKRVWHCWRCQRTSAGVGAWVPGFWGRGGLLDLIQVLEGCDRNAAVTMVLAGVTRPHLDASELPSDFLVVGETAFTGPFRPVTIPAPEGWRPVTRLMPFMVERGITMEDAVHFGLGWCECGRYVGRLVFPVWEDGALVYYQARAMWSKIPGQPYVKALNPPRREGAAVSSEVLMNLDLARGHPRVAIVEGPIDCVHAGPSAVATFGKTISPVQVAKLVRAGVKAVDLMWDADAVDEIAAAAVMLSAHFDTRAVFLPGGDPGDYSREELDRFRAGGLASGQVSRIARL